jgi:predicted RNA binding protein with dsRBD fold (UPF0201 family)
LVELEVEAGWALTTAVPVPSSCHNKSCDALDALWAVLADQAILNTARNALSIHFCKVEIIIAVACLTNQADCATQAVFAEWYRSAILTYRRCGCCVKGKT